MAGNERRQVPQGQPIIARRFNAGTVFRITRVPQGTAEFRPSKLWD